MFNLNQLEQKLAFERQMTGMSEIPFFYEDDQPERNKLIERVKVALSQIDKDFFT